MMYHPLGPFIWGLSLQFGGVRAELPDPTCDILRQLRPQPATGLINYSYHSRRILPEVLAIRTSSRPACSYRECRSHPCHRYNNTAGTGQPCPPLAAGSVFELVQDLTEPYSKMPKLLRSSIRVIARLPPQFEYLNGIDFVWKLRSRRP